MERRSSGGNLEMGHMRCWRSRSMLTLISRMLGTPRDDWESFDWIMKKSVSSSRRASGELIEESDSDTATLACLLCE
jgi:hypothetical protein